MAYASILRDDPDLAQHLEPADAEIASRRAVARVVCAPKGLFYAPEVLPGGPGTLGMLILDGLLLRAITVADRPSVEVLGSGDVVRPFEPEPDPRAIVHWWGLRPARLAVLDASFICRMSHHPEVIAELAGRLSLASARGGVRLSIVQQPRLATRLHFMLWHLADRFGRVHPDGVVLPVPLCDTLLGWLGGASRPAVNRAVKELERTGRISRRPDSSWWLAWEPQGGFDELALGAEAVPA